MNTRDTLEKQGKNTLDHFKVMLDKTILAFNE